MQAIPRPEYPRPEMVRSSWKNLNGEWDFEMDLSKSKKEQRFYETGTYTQKIVVPFCPESKLSGIGNLDFMAAVWYRKKVVLTDEQTAGTTLLHFGAVDYLCEVWVNGSSAGSHCGGYASFSFDISPLVHAGENSIIVYAQDDNRACDQPFGKQSDQFYSYACSYTRTTGIWQTVWLEFTAKESIAGLRCIGDAVNGRLHAEIDFRGSTSGMTVHAAASYKGKAMGAGSAVVSGSFAMVTIDLNEIHRWDVGKPELYDLTFTLTEHDHTIDRVDSYFGLRSIELTDRAILLNGKPVFQRLVLDQGFYPDGIYTAPTDEALKRDITLAMELGFNGARLHQKVFEPRFLYWADQLGYLVWGEHASWGLDITTAKGIEGFLPEWLEIMKRDFNHASIVGWCPFNETWDQRGAQQDNMVLKVTYLATKALDPTRPVIDTSGNFHVITDIYDVHDYEQNVQAFAAHYEPMSRGGAAYENYPLRQTYGGQPYFVSEYGGTWWNAAEALKNSGDSGWGYGNRPTSEQEVSQRYVGLTTTLLQNPSICALCYTQLYDVEQEKNGLYYYNREKKFSDEIYAQIRAANVQPAAIEEKSGN